MMAMPAARKYGQTPHSPEAVAECGGGGADRELVLLHAILSFGLPQQTAVSQNERNMAVVFKNPTLSESAFNADSDSVGFLKTTSHLMPLRRPQRLSAQAEREELCSLHSTCLTKVMGSLSQSELTALSDRSIILVLMRPWSMPAPGAVGTM